MDLSSHNTHQYTHAMRAAGRQLLERCLAGAAGDASLKEVAVHVQEGNDEAIAFYKAAGFEVCVICHSYACCACCCCSCVHMAVCFHPTAMARCCAGVSDCPRLLQATHTLICTPHDQATPANSGNGMSALNKVSLQSRCQLASHPLFTRQWPAAPHMYKTHSVK
jgi:hypothetical protein